MPRSIQALTSIACILHVVDGVKSAALPLAVKTAEAAGAFLSVAVIAPKAQVPFSVFGSSYVGPLVADLNKQSLSEAEVVLTEAPHLISNAGLKGDVQISHDSVDVAAAQAVLAARAADLIVVDQPSAMLDVKGLVLEEALFRSGRPVLVAPAKSSVGRAVRHIAIAWDGSPHAARAVADALSFFQDITSADVVVVQGEKNLSKSLPGADLAQHLARKGIEAKLVELQANERPVGKVLDDYALDAGADLLVMGGFGHSRVREFLFGGVTVELSQGASVPLLMAY
jgi:nucleotide-binding universal stress UspA family protein